MKQLLLVSMTPDQMAEELAQTYFHGNDGWTDAMNTVVNKYEETPEKYQLNEKYLARSKHRDRMALEAWKEASSIIADVYGCENLGDEEFDRIMVPVDQGPGFATKLVEDCIKGLVSDYVTRVEVAKALRSMERVYPSKQVFPSGNTWNRIAFLVE